MVTLLPAATEIVATLGGADQLVGISHECDYPGWVQQLPRVTATSVDVRSPGRVIDAEVGRLRSSGRPIIAIDADQLATLAPDLIITQELCEVCAVSDGEVHRLAAVLQGRPKVMSLAARDLAGIWSDISEVGKALDLGAEAEELMLGLKSRLGRLRGSTAGLPPKVLCIEWLRPDHIVVMLCGFGVGRARAELDALDDPDALELMRRVPTWIIDGNAYTSRPGPRVVDGAVRIRSALLEQPAHDIESWQPVGC